jgi:hypothetical protein
MCTFHYEDFPLFTSKLADITWKASAISISVIQQTLLQRRFGFKLETRLCCYFVSYCFLRFIAYDTALRHRTMEGLKFKGLELVTAYGEGTLERFS